MTLKGVYIFYMRTLPAQISGSEARFRLQVTQSIPGSAGRYRPRMGWDVWQPNSAINPEGPTTEEREIPTQQGHPLYIHPRQSG
jgi:hypothetical protein